MNSKTHQIEFRVYTENTDMMGIVYHAYYLSFFERARTEMIRSTGLSLSTLGTYDYHFAIAEAQLRYLYPARLDDVLKITTKINNKTPCSVSFEQVMHNQHDKLICEAQIKVVSVNSEMKPKRLPENLF